MKKLIFVEIECGEKTCASEPGRFCQFFISSMNGKDSCFLFGRVFDEDGWIMRHKDCLKYTEWKKEHKL